jgi:hypothetical protein
VEAYKEINGKMALNDEVLAIACQHFLGKVRLAWAWYIIDPLAQSHAGRCERQSTHAIHHPSPLQPSLCPLPVWQTVHEIQQTLLKTMEGHQRQILGTMTVEELYRSVCVSVCVWVSVWCTS